MDCASEFKINLLETVIPGFHSHFGYKEESGREPQHCLELDKGPDSSPCISIFPAETQKDSALCARGFTHMDRWSLCLLLLDSVMPASSFPSSTTHTPRTLL